jgi:nucleotide-binding universal stress UspA family protein
MKTILVAIDFSPVTRKVMAEAARLAWESGGRLVLLNVTAPARIGRDHDRFMKTVAEFADVGGQAAAEKCSMNKTSRVRSVRGDTVQLVGEPTQMILEEARKLAADYIVMGLHERTPLHDLGARSTVVGVLKHAPCPVLLVPGTSPAKHIHDVAPGASSHVSFLQSLRARFHPV